MAERKELTLAERKAQERAARTKLIQKASKGDQKALDTLAGGDERTNLGHQECGTVQVRHRQRSH